MLFIAINLSITDILLLLVMAFVLGLVVYFVITSRKNLQKMLEESSKENSIAANSNYYNHYNDVPAPKPAAPLQQAASFFNKAKQKTQVKEEPAPAEESIHTLKENIRQQQKSLDVLLRKVDKWTEQEAVETDYKDENKELKEELEEVNDILQQKNEELKSVKQQLAAAQKMAARIDEVHKEFDGLQQKISELEKTARGANELAIEMEEMKQSYLQVKKELTRKHEKLEEVAAENRRLHEELNDTEDKLSEANLQRQQLMKKVQLLESMNTEFQHMTAANKKLQTELRRIAELESMLSMVSDERDILLKKRSL